MIIESGNLLEFDSRWSKHISIEASTIEHNDFGRARSKHILLSSSIVEHVFFGRTRSKRAECWSIRSKKNSKHFDDPVQPGRV